MTTASIPRTPRQRLILSSELSSKASDKYCPKSTCKSNLNVVSTRKSTGRSPSSRQPVQIKMPLVKADPNHWTTRLRKTLRDSNGRGWGIEPQSDRIKITYREPGTAQRSAATLDLGWTASSSGDVMETVRTLRQLMEDQNTTLAKAYRFYRERHFPSFGGALNWVAITTAFMDDLRSKKYRASTRRGYQFVCDKALEIMDGEEPPTTGPELQRQVFNVYLSHNASGAWARRRNTEILGRILRYAVESGGAPEQWLPMETNERRELVGPADSADSRLTPPVKPTQLSWLLDELERTGEHELRLAVGLVGLFGLRPCELATLEFARGRLWVGKVKRNAADMKQSGVDQKRKGKRLVMAIDVPGKEGLGDELAELWANGGRKFPATLRKWINQHKEGRDALQIVGNSFGNMLLQQSAWQSLKAEEPDLTPYSLRHSWAFRSQTSGRPLSIRDAAALLGHTPATFFKHYGHWTDESSLIEAMEAFRSGTTCSA